MTLSDSTSEPTTPHGNPPLHSEPQSATKYPKPKIILIDMPEQCSSVLSKAGYSVTSGSFGQPYRVTPSDQCAWVCLDSIDLVNAEEQEILFINLASPYASSNTPGESPGEGVIAFWQRSDLGLIDSRPIVMEHMRENFDRILRHGGMAIVMLAEHQETTYQHGSFSKHRGLKITDELYYSNWDCLTALGRLSVSNIRGHEIRWDRNIDLCKLLKKGSDDGRFECSVTIHGGREKSWLPLGNNKYGETVAGAYIDKEGVPYLLVLPQLPHFDRIILELLEGWCALWKPRLFPSLDANNWKHWKQYEIEEVISLESRIEVIEDSAAKQVESLRETIRNIKIKEKDRYTLLGGTGDELVGAVIRTMQALGFTKVVDVDAQAREGGGDRMLREDIQIHDRDPILIVDVKGVIGHPEDAEATQSEKHALMRSREFEGKVKPLTIINYQRNLPPIERDKLGYRREIIDNAAQTGLGLMTSWDLFRLLKNKKQLNWPSKAVQSVFYRSGLIEPIPEHYTLAGKIEHVWQHAFGVIPSQTIHSGSVIGIEIGDAFEEVEVASLQVDEESVDVAKTDSNCGIECEDASSRFRVGMRVFVVDTSGEEKANP